MRREVPPISLAALSTVEMILRFADTIVRMNDWHSPQSSIRQVRGKTDFHDIAGKPGKSGKIAICLCDSRDLQWGLAVSKGRSHERDKASGPLFALE
jgi:hypothetical protein